jgi:hypothetical protein
MVCAGLAYWLLGAVLKPENNAVKIEGALQASHLQMHMPDADVGIDRSFLN